MVEWNIGRKRFDVYVHKRVSPESALPCKTSAMRWSPRCVDEVRVLYPWTWPVLEMSRPSPPNGGRWLTSCNSQTTIDQPHGKLNERCSLVLMSEAIISEKCCSLPGGYFDNRNFFSIYLLRLVLRSVAAARGLLCQFRLRWLMNQLFTCFSSSPVSWIRRSFSSSCHAQNKPIHDVMKHTQNMLPLR